MSSVTLSDIIENKEFGLSSAFLFQSFAIFLASCGAYTSCEMSHPPVFQQPYLWSKFRQLTLSFPEKTSAPETEKFSGTSHLE